MDRRKIPDGTGLGDLVEVGILTSGGAGSLIGAAPAGSADSIEGAGTLTVSGCDDLTTGDEDSLTKSEPEDLAVKGASSLAGTRPRDSIVGVEFEDVMT